MTQTQILPNNPISVAPSGDVFSLPSRADFEQELERPNNLVEEQRRLGREIVVVMGVGFVGTVIGAVVADAVDRATGKPLQIVIGMRRPSSRPDWKIPLLNRGVSPVLAEDPEVASMIRRCVRSKKEKTPTARSLARFFRNQERLVDLRITKSISDRSCPEPTPWFLPSVIPTISISIPIPRATCRESLWRLSIVSASWATGRSAGTSNSVER